MCELLGISFNQQIRPNISLKSFRQRGIQNPDGWGIAWYPDKAVQIIKEPIKSNESCILEFLYNYKNIKSNLFIAHVRRASSGNITYRNTHPFSRELNGKDYTFAHNGTLKYNNGRSYSMDLQLGRFHPIGDSDSEHAFCYILKNIEERNIKQWNNADFNWIWEIFKEINNYGTFNCLLSDGEILFCYYDKNGYNGLSFLLRKFPFGKIKLIDEDYEIDLNIEKDPNQVGFLIASKALTNERWESFQFGELKVFKYGEILFSSHN